MKRDKNIRHVSGDAEKVFKVMASKVKVIVTFVAGGIQFNGSPSKTILFRCTIVISFFSINVAEYYKQLKTTAIFWQDK